MPFPPNSSSCPKKLSSEYQLYACGNFFGLSLILDKIAILGQPPRTYERKGFFTEKRVEYKKGKPKWVRAQK
jgi:hypothetical protein